MLHRLVIAAGAAAAIALTASAGYAASKHPNLVRIPGTQCYSAAGASGEICYGAQTASAALRVVPRESSKPTAFENMTANQNSHSADINNGN